MMDRKGSSLRRAVLLCLVLEVATVGMYLQTWDHRFINFDDPGYVTANPRVRGGLTWANVAWAFSATAMSNWHPLTWLSHMMDVQLFGLSSGGHHLTNVIFHAASTALLFFLLYEITGFSWRSLFVAGLFALHPLHVESVAWVAERKDVLSGLFWFLTLLLYVQYVKRRGTARYLLVLLSFAAGLMAKPMLVTLPLVMLLLDGWPLNRFEGDPASGAIRKGTGETTPFWSLIREKTPFLLLSALSSAMTVYAQQVGGALKDLETAPFGPRLANAPVAYVAYLVKTIWPRELAMLYPFSPAIPAWKIVGSILALAIISTLTFGQRRSRPYLVTGWFWFLITLLPVIGIVQVGGQSMADRYTYLPLTGLFIACAWGIGELSEGWRYRKALLAGVTAAIVIVCGALTWRQAGYWRDDITLYRHTLRITDRNYLIRNNYGIALAQEGRFDEAIEQYREALRVWPNSANAHVNLGAAFANQGRFSEAISHYERALRLIPDYALAHANLGRALASVGRTDEAIAQYVEAVRLDPAMADVHLNLAILLLDVGMRAEALRHYETARRIDPYSAKTPNNMGIAIARQGRMDEAAAYFTQALRIDPSSVEAHFNLGVILARRNRFDEAAYHFSEVLRLKPDSDAARRWLEALKQ